MRVALIALLLSSAGCRSLFDSTAVAEEQAFVPPVVHEATVLSDSYHVDAIYRSMTGPSSAMYVDLGEQAAPELVWITGYESTVVLADGTEVSQEFMCHANLDFDPQVFYEHFDTRVPISGRLFTLSQGQQVIDFPPGFGIPHISTDPITLSTQVLNLNDPNVGLDVRHRVTVRYVRDTEVAQPMRPLFQAAVQGFKSLEGEGVVYGVENPEVEDHGEGCAVGSSAVDGDVDYDRLGRKFTAHWVVEPGVEETRTTVTEFLNLPFDTTAHYIAVHLHPFAQSLELIDRTAGTTVFKSMVRAPDDRIGITEVEYFESPDGMMFHADHEYELLSVYNNTTTGPVDSMAVMYIYFLDPGFTKPDLTRIAAVTEDDTPPVDAGM